jgi:hypothetical protein
MNAIIYCFFQIYVFITIIWIYGFGKPERKKPGR